MKDSVYNELIELLNNSLIQSPCGNKSEELIESEKILIERRLYGEAQGSITAVTLNCCVKPKIGG